MKKTILSCVVMFHALVSMAGTASAGTDIYTTDGYKATVLEDGTVAITWIYNEGEVTIPSEVTDKAEASTGSYQVSKVGATYAICENNKITKLVLSEGIKTIGQTAFWGISSISSLSLPSTLTKIESYAFGDCTGLTEITSAATVAPALGDDVFKTSDTDKGWNYIGQNCKLIVPSGATSNYQNTGTWTYWDTFANIEEAQPTSIGQASVSIPNMKKGLYTIGGVKVADSLNLKQLPHGVYVVNGKKVVR